MVMPRDAPLDGYGHESACVCDVWWLLCGGLLLVMHVLLLLLLACALLLHLPVAKLFSRSATTCLQK